MDIPLGLAPETWQLYLALASRPEDNLEQLAARSGIDSKRLGQLLALLLQHGLARHSLERVSGWAATTPQSGVAPLIRSRSRELLGDLASLLSLEQVSRGLPDAPERRASIADSAGMAHVGTAAELWSALREQAGDASGISWMGAPAWGGRELPSRWLVTAGEQAPTLPPGWTSQDFSVRQMRTLPMTVGIVADKAVGMKTGDGEAGLICTMQPFLTLGEEVYETAWRRAVPVDASTEPGWAELRARTETHPRLLPLLCIGFPDARIAEVLGVSLRTVGRQIARVLEALGARNRAHAGALICRAIGVGSGTPGQ